jgi:[ribosomal protein S5]-alanine N-acetyltransferase
MSAWHAMIAAVGRIRGWPATLTEPDLLGTPVVLRPARISDARTLRQVREANASWLRPWDPSNPETSQTRSPTAPLAAMVRRSPIGPYVSIIRLWQEAMQGGTLSWVVCFDGRLVGQFTVWSIVWGSSRSAQVGYWIDERFAGRGIAPTVLSMAVDYCFRVVGLHRIEARIRPENAASGRVVEKLGFRDEGIRVRDAHIDAAWRNHISYAITAEEVPTGMLSRWRSSLTALRSGT